MKATIVTIGDEILIGQITDTNSGYIAKALDKVGVQTHEMISISDDRKHILDTFARLQNQTDLVIITGGLGPTKDDITKHTFCEYSLFTNSVRFCQYGISKSAANTLCQDGWILTVM